MSREREDKIEEGNREMVEMMSQPRQFVCGTRAVKRVSIGDWRAVCATCGGGGTVSYDTQDGANRRAVKDSNKPCQCRGCYAR